MDTNHESGFHRERVCWALTLLEQARTGGDPRMVRLAERRLHAVKADAGRAAQSAEKKRHTLQQTQTRLQTSPVSTPDEARLMNERHREAAAATESAAAEVLAFQQVLSATSTGDLGGPVDLDAVIFAASSVRADVLTRRSALVIGVLALISLFLPWLHIDQASGSLIGLAGVLQAAGLIRPPVPVVLYVVPVVALLLVGTGVVLVGLARQTLAIVWMVIALGCATLAMAFFPTALALSRAETLIDYMAAGALVGPGAWLYAFCGAALVYLGARCRDALLDKNGYPLLAAVSTVLITVAFFALLGLAVAIAPKGGGIRFDPSWSTTHLGILEISVYNQSDNTVALHAPAPAGRVGSASRHPWYGVTLEVREVPGKAFRAIPEATGVWSVSGPSGEMPLLLNPGTTKLVRLNTLALRQALGTVAEVKLVFRRGGGSIVSEFSSPVPFQTASAETPDSPERLARVLPGPVETEPVQTPDPPEATLPPVTPVPSVEGLPDTPPVSEPALPVPPPAPIHWTVTLSGIVGDLGAFSVLPPNSSRRERVTARTGDEVAPGWTVRSMVASPASAELEQRGVGQTRMIRRGETVELSPAP